MRTPVWCLKRPKITQSKNRSNTFLAALRGAHILGTREGSPAPGRVFLGLTPTHMSTKVAYKPK